MQRSRGPVVLALALALTGGACAGMSAGAAAASAPHGASALPAFSSIDTITVEPAVASAAPGGERLSVTADSTSGLTSMTVHLLDSTDNGDKLNLTMSPPSGGSPPDGGLSTWASDVITTTALPLDTYNVTVDAADAQTSVTAAPAGTFAFQDKASISPNPVNTVLSYDNKTPVISGTVTVLAPGATAPAPYAGQVFIADPRLSGGGMSVTTSASGAYSYTFSAPVPGETFTVEVQPTTATTAAATPPSTFGVRADPVTISASLSAKSIRYGSKATVSGTVRYQPGSTLVPLRKFPVRIYDRPGAAKPVATAVTDATGHFAATLPKEAASVHWVLRAAGPYLRTATVTLPMKVSLPTVIRGFQAALSQFWQVSFRGCLTLPAGVPGYVPSLAGLAIQYAATPKGPWHTLGPLPRQATVLCGNGGRAFSGRLAAKLNYAYYRAWYAGATDAAGTGYLPVASVKVLAWKYEDRITGFSVSPLVLHRNATLTVKGQLQYFSGRWRDYARQPVYVILRPAGSKTWYFIMIATTNSAGRFSASLADPATAAWSAEFFGNSTHLATVAPAVNVRVT